MILVSRAGFVGLLAAVGDDVGSTGQYAEGAAVGTAAQFVYDAATGGLFWEENGSGTGGATLLATLSGAPDLAAADIVVIA